MREAIRLLEEAERSKGDNGTLEAARDAGREWRHLDTRLARVSVASDRLDQKRTRKEARVNRSIAAAKRSGEPASIQAAASAATAAGMAHEATELLQFLDAVENARRLVKRANASKDLEDIAAATVAAGKFDCLRCSQQFQHLKTMAASSPGPGTDPEEH